MVEDAACGVITGLQISSYYKNVRYYKHDGSVQYCKLTAFKAQEEFFMTFSAAKNSVW